MNPKQEQNNKPFHVVVWGNDDKAVEMAAGRLALEGSDKMPLVVGTIEHIDHGITTLKEKPSLPPIVIPTIESFPLSKNKSLKRKIDISKRRK